MQREFEIKQDLADLYSALRKRIVLGEMLGTAPTVGDELLRAIYKKSTKIGKTDSFVSNEEEEDVNGRLERVRAWTFAHGEQETQGPVERYVSKADRMEVAADKDEGIKQGDISYYLWLYTYDERCALGELALTVDFQKQYQLEVGFENEPGRESETPDFTASELDPYGLANSISHYRYMSGRHNLKDMDSRDFKIISFYLDQFMQAKQIK